MIAQADGTVLLKCPSPTPKIVFVTSSTYSGNLGGLQGADAQCQYLANAAGHEGVFKAWLSSSTASPATRFTQPNSFTPYTLVDGTVIAYGWLGITSGTLLSPINKDEKGATRYYQIFTDSTVEGGEEYSDLSCADWTTGQSGANAIAGAAGEYRSGWTVYGVFPCDGSVPTGLYCFQQ
jgi:hypothetical protein